MSKVKCVVDREAVGELLKSDEMAACVEKEASRMVASLGEGYNFKTKNMGTRTVSVFTVTDEAAIENIKNNSMLKVIRK